MAVRQVTDLLDREAELERIEAFVADVASGEGRALLVEGPAGIGKSELVERAADRASESGIRVLRARAGELESGLSFGVVHQLFDELVLRAGAAERELLLMGPAHIASRLLEPTDGDLPGRGELDEGAVLHGLYWLLQNVATDTPVLVAIDDVHWADAPSLRWFSYLAVRIANTPAGILLAARPERENGGTGALERLASDPAVEILRPRALSPLAVARLVRERYDSAAEDDFCRACWDATGGNPFFCRELVAAIRSDEIPPTAGEAARIRELTPDAITRAVVTRLGALTPPARELARSAAVLGADAPLRSAAALAALDPEEASDAADELVAAGMLAPARPLEFVHPVVRTVIYQDIPAGGRSKRHRTAARLLEEDGGLTERVAIHLLATDPAGDPWTVEALRAVAAAGVSPEAEVAYLRRALAEPASPAERSSLLESLGMAEMRAMDPLALEHLEGALDQAEDPVSRARISLGLAAALEWSGRFEEMAATCQAALSELEPHDRDPDARELGLMLRTHLLLENRGRRAPEEPLELLWDRVAEAATPGEAALLGRLAYLGCFAGIATADKVADAALKTLTSPHAADRRLWRRFRYDPIWALEFCDHFDEAEQALAEELNHAREVASPQALAFAHTALAIIAFKRGHLQAALEHAETACELALEHDLGILAPISGAILASTLLERGELETAGETLDATEPRAGSPSDTTPSSLALHRFVRGRLMLTCRDPNGALALLQEAGALMHEGMHDHPAYYAWRSEAALAELQRGGTATASELAREELEMARAFGAPVAIGRALRVCGLVDGDEPLLREAVDVLATTPAELELAKALVDLGAMLRRGRRRSEARDVLVRGLEAADRCGALMLGERAREELDSLGVRPPRAQVAGIHALTPSERRVAGMAAEGMTNREIARTLFLSVKTIEKHLGQAYLKLGVGSRRELPQALEAADRPQGR